jgi:hypothetical protein
LRKYRQKPHPRYPNPLFKIRAVKLKSGIIVEICTEETVLYFSSGNFEQNNYRVNGAGNTHGAFALGFSPIPDPSGGSQLLENEFNAGRIYKCAAVYRFKTSK